MVAVVRCATQPLTCLQSVPPAIDRVSGRDLFSLLPMSGVGSWEIVAGSARGWGESERHDRVCQGYGMSDLSSVFICIERVMRNRREVGLEGARTSRTLSSPEVWGRINHLELTACDGAVVSLSSSMLSPWPMQHHSPLRWKQKA